MLSMTLRVLLIDVLGWLPTLGRPRICAEDIQLGSRDFGGRFRVAHGTLTSLEFRAGFSIRIDSRTGKGRKIFEVATKGQRVKKQTISMLMNVNILLAVRSKIN